MSIVDVSDVGAEDAFFRLDPHPAVVIVPDFGDLHVVAVRAPGDGGLAGLPHHVQALAVAVKVALQ